MKKIFTLLVALLSCIVSQSQTGPSFSITNTSGTNFITCSNTSVNYVATSSANLTYLWVSSNATLSGASVSITVPGNYSVTATDTLNNTSVQMVSVLINTVLPVSTVSPNIQSISCVSPTTQFIIIVSPTPGSIPANQTQSISSQYGAPYVLNSNASFIYQATAPGTYTYLQVDNNNGCTSLKSFTVTSSSGFPTFSLTSPQNFTLGCNTKSVAVINFINAQTNPPGGAVSYSLVGTFGAISTFTINAPGTYTAAVRDNFTNCETRVPFTVQQNTATPHISVSVPHQILDCITTQVILNSSSNTPNVSFEWKLLGTPPSVLSNSIMVGINSIAPSSTFISTYTAVITDNGNTCKSMSVIPMYQNTFKPKAAISSAGINSLTCITQTLVLTNVSSSGIPLSTGFPVNQPVIGLLWTGPSPQPPAANSSTYLASVAGSYTLEVKDLNNGCTSNTTIVIGDSRVYPQINMPSSYFVDCPGTVTLSATLGGFGAGHSYSWTAPFNATTSILTTPNLITSSAGYYYLTVTNTITGCSSTASTVVQACVGLASNENNIYTIKVFPNPGSGKFTINSINLPGHSKLEIYNSVGQLIKTVIIESDQIELNLENESKGLYFLKVKNESKLLSIQKILKQ